MLIDLCWISFTYLFIQLPISSIVHWLTHFQNVYLEFSGLNFGNKEEENLVQN